MERKYLWRTASSFVWSQMATASPAALQLIASPNSPGLPRISKSCKWACHTNLNFPLSNSVPSDMFTYHPPVPLYSVPSQLSNFQFRVANRIGSALIGGWKRDVLTCSPFWCLLFGISRWDIRQNACFPKSQKWCE